MNKTQAKYAQTNHFTMVKGIAILIACMIFIIIPQNAQASTSRFAQTALESEQGYLNEIEEIIARVDQKYNLKVSYTNLPQISTLSFGTLSKSTDLHKALQVIEECLQIYPDDFAGMIKLQSIYLCSNLRVGSSWADGLSNASYFGDRLRRSQIYLSVPSSNGASYTFHHEMLHIMEYAFPIDSDAWTEAAGGKDKAVYYDGIGTGDRQARDFVDKEGYATYYAGHSPEEDRAETYAMLMSFAEEDDNNSKKFQKRYANDQILKSKADFIMEFCYSVFDGDEEYMVVLQNGYDAIFGNN